MGSRGVPPYVFVAVALLLGITLWVGPTLFVNHPITADDVQELGGQVLGGTVIAGAIFVAERMINERIQQEHLNHEEAREIQEELHAQLTSQQDISNLDFSKYNAKLTPPTVVFGQIAIRTNFSGANLQGSSFEQSNFTSAKFTKADLRRVQFDRCILNNADFRGAKLQGTSLTFFPGEEERRLKGANFAGAYYDSRTIWPPEFDPKEAGTILKEDAISE